MRVPAMVCCPQTVPAGMITEEMLSAHDWYKTFAALAGASDKVPADRPLDGVDASKFLLGESEHTGRDDLVFFCRTPVLGDPCPGDGQRTRTG